MVPHPSWNTLSQEKEGESYVRLCSSISVERTIVTKTETPNNVSLSIAWYFLYFMRQVVQTFLCFKENSARFKGHYNTLVINTVLTKFYVDSCLKSVKTVTDENSLLCYFQIILMTGGIISN